MKNNNRNNLREKTIILFFMIASFLLLLLAASACCPSKPQPTNQITKIEKDSVFTTIKHVYKDTTIVVEGDKIELKIPSYSITETPTTIRTQNGLNLSLQRINDSILANCNQEDKIQIIQLQNQIIETYKSKITELEQIEQIPVPYTPKLTKFLAWIGGIATICTLFFGFFRIKKFLKF